MDLIDRQAAIDAVRSYMADSEIADSDWHADGIAYDIRRLPSAQPERRTGKWLMRPDPYGFFKGIPVCSACGCTTKWREKYLYCPNCGTKMEVKNDE